MTSRREAVVQQRENRLEAMRDRVQGVHFDIHLATQASLQRTLLDELLRAESQKTQKFSVMSTRHIFCRTEEEAAIYCDFFARCVQGTWMVTFARCETGFEFKFEHV